MFGFLLEVPKGLPETVWACKTAVKDYSWENRNSPDMVEISISRANDRIVEVVGREPLRVSGRSLSAVVGDIPIKSFAESGVSVEILSVAVRFDGLSARAKEFDETDLCRRDVLLIPHRAELLGKKELDETEDILHKYIHSYVEGKASSRLECARLALELLCRLDAIARRSEPSKNDKYVNYYVMKTEAMIKRSYSQKISLDSIAKELGITPSYLSMIYKKASGVTFSQRLSEIRIEKAKELLASTDLSVAEISELSGLGDESNLRKRFKQKMGIGIREYRSISKEQTLYHKKPERDAQK